ncbi:c-type cytochrome [Boseongicola aestuarii]|uniref:Fructose dehydrogenase cytochrome subunit n=1 Tax=Boseongicola aestuarii TaxID=1470561 RepID=A0A238J3F8_9RHOB|nr:c-type cytochrome [Boseongicola aestuarii]SMX24873.1 Fructose dehydrogenase cytochrome subunit precursor [Boseongicola aestuarii]
MRIAVCTIAVTFAGTLALAEPSIERGQYLVEGPAGCGNCHTPFGAQGPDMTKNLAGCLVEETPAFTAIAPNLTLGGRVSEWSDAELARAIREGITPGGTRVIGPPMPIALYSQLSDDDVMSIVAYLRSIPAVENDAGQSVYNIPLPPAYGPPIDTVAHCVECHSPMGPMGPDRINQLGAGGFEFHGPWGTSVSANLTPHPEDGISKWTDEELVQMISTGVRPDGSAMMPPMGYAYYSSMTPADLDAIILYLRQLPPLADPC